MSILKDELYKRIVSDSLSRPFCLQWGKNGSLAIMTREALHIYTPVFRPSIMYQARWISLCGETVSKPTKASSNVDNEVPTSLRQFLQRSQMNEIQLSFSACSWCCNPFYCGGADLLSMMLNNGTLLLLRRKDSSSRLNLSNEFAHYNLQFCGYEVICDISTYFSAWTKHNRCEKCNFTISNYVLLVDRTSRSIFVVLTCGLLLTVFQIVRDSVTGALLMNNIGSHDFNPSGLSVVPLCQCVGEEGGVSTGSLRINSLSASEEVMHGSDGTSCFALLLSTNDGAVAKLKCTVHLAEKMSFSTLWFRPSDPQLSSGSLQLLAQTSLNNSSIQVVANNSVFNISMEQHQLTDGHNDMQSIPLSHEYIVSGWTTVTAIDQSANNAAMIHDTQITCSVDGVVCAWPISSGTSSSSALSSDVIRNITVHEDVTRHTGLYGIASDPLGLMLAYTHKINAAHDHSKEVQMNPTTLHPRAALLWQISPNIDPLWVDSVDTMTNVLSAVINRCSAVHINDEHISLMSLPMMVLQSIDHLKKTLKDYSSLNHTVYTDVLSEQQLRMNSEVVDLNVDLNLTADRVNSDDSDQDENGDEDEISLKKYKAKAKKPVGGFAPVTNTSKTVKQLYDHMASINAHIKKFLGPSREVLLTHAIEKLLQSSAFLSERIQNETDMSVYNTCTDYYSANSHTLTKERILEMILYLPTDPVRLKKKITLWQSIHVIVLAIHQYRDFTMDTATLQWIQDLRYVLSVAHAILTMQRFQEKYNQEATISQNKMFSSDPSHTKSLLHTLSILDNYDHRDSSIVAEIDSLSSACRETLRDLFAESRLKVKSTKKTTITSEIETQFEAYCKQLLTEKCAVCDSFIPSPPIETDSTGKVSDSILCNVCGVKTEKCCFTHLPLFECAETTSLADSSASSTSNINSNVFNSNWSGSGSTPSMKQQQVKFDGSVLQCPCCHAVTREVNGMHTGGGIADIYSISSSSSSAASSVNDNNNNNNNNTCWIEDIMSPLCPYCSLQLIQV